MLSTLWVNLSCLHVKYTLMLLFIYFAISKPLWVKVFFLQLGIPCLRLFETWIGFPHTRRSKIGYFITLGGASISWNIKKQYVVFKSFAEAEYWALAFTMSEILWLLWLLQDLEAPQYGHTSLYCDNQTARHIANNLVSHKRTKHVEIDCFFICKCIESREIQTFSICSNEQVVDTFTKPLGTEKFCYLPWQVGCSWSSHSNLIRE